MAENICGASYGRYALPVEKWDAKTVIFVEAASHVRCPALTHSFQATRPRTFQPLPERLLALSFC